MQMTEQEICKEYREAKDPNRQLTILAQLNACGAGDIVAILEKNGEPLRKRLYQKNTKPKKEAKADEIPSGVLTAVRDRMEWLNLKIVEYHTELDEIEKEFKQLEQFLKKYQKKENPNDKRNNVCEAQSSELSGNGEAEGEA